MKRKDRVEIGERGERGDRGIPNESIVPIYDNGAKLTWLKQSWSILVDPLHFVFDHIFH